MEIWKKMLVGIFFWTQCILCQSVSANMVECRFLQQQHCLTPYYIIEVACIIPARLMMHTRRSQFTVKTAREGQFRSPHTVLYLYA